MRKDYSKVIFVIETALSLWESFCTAHKNKFNGKEGVYVAVFETDHYNSAGTVAGNMTEEQRIAHGQLAWEKTTWLMQNPTVYTSLGMKKHIEAGGIQTISIVIGISGLPPLYNHLFARHVLENSDNLGKKVAEFVDAEFELHKNDI